MYRHLMNFLNNFFEQQCVLLHALFNQGEISDLCPFIDLNDEYFNLQCLSNAKTLFSETWKEKYSPFSSKRKGFVTKLFSTFVATYRKVCDVGMKRRALKA